MAGKLFRTIFSPERDGNVAVIFERRHITYAGLKLLTTATAERLTALNVQPGDRIAILLNDSPEFIASFLATISIGAIAVPINMALRKPDQLFILKDCGARAAIVEGEAVESLLADLPSNSELKDVLVVFRDGDVRATSFPAVRTQPFDKAQVQPLIEIRQGDWRADAFILYTSGSTGEPKGAVHTQFDIFYTNETYCSEVLNLRVGDRLFSSSRLPFAYGLGNALTFPLLNGLTTILCREKPAPEVIARIFRDYRPTIFFGVPVVYRMLLEHHRTGVRVSALVGSAEERSPTEVGTLNTSSLRLCISAGEALPAQLGEDWQKTFAVQVLDGIGSTEMLHMFMSNHEDDVRYGTSGKLLKGYEAKLVDHDGVPVERGMEGNLWIRGQSAASRYWQRPEISTQTFVDGWVRTGDLYREDLDGFWQHMGRSDDCFKPTGQWVSPVEVEGVLLKSDAIRAAAVVEGSDKDGLSCVCAFVVRADDRQSAQSVEEALQALCESALPRFKQPRRYIFISELPYTATGKVQRYKLREQLRSPKSKVQSPMS